MNQQIYDFVKNKKVTVLGLGVSNRPLLKILTSCDTASITVGDKSEKEAFESKHSEYISDLNAKNVRFIFGGDYLSAALNADIIFRAPGIRPDYDEIVRSVKNGAVLTSEMELFMEYCPAKIIAVTGSDGKTTTTTLISEILKASGYTVHTGGNIGKPLLDKLDSIKPSDIVALELSSFQLHTMKKSPHIAVITNVNPNHLDWHKDYDEYISAKKNIYKNQTDNDKLILSTDNAVASVIAEESYKGTTVKFTLNDNGNYKNGNNLIYSKNGVIRYIDGGNNDSVMLNESDILLPGRFNAANYMAAIGATLGLADTEAYAKVASSFGGVEHRMEFVRALNGAKYYNSSIDSSPSRSAATFSAFGSNVIAIMAGRGKGVPFDSLAESICNHCKKLILMGEIKDQIFTAVTNSPFISDKTISIEFATDMNDAVIKAHKAAQSGDTVLLSPGGTSFDMYNNFEERGRDFKNIVNSL